MVKLNSIPGALALSGGLALAVISVVELTADETTQKQTATKTEQSAPSSPASAINAEANRETGRHFLDMSARADDGELGRPKWAASATGRVETRTGEHRLTALEPRRIEDVYVNTHDQVKAGDILLKFDDADLQAKRLAALAEVQVRLLEREEEKVTGLALDRQKAEDAWAEAERALYDARLAQDQAVIDHRNGKIGDDALENARKAVTDAEKKAADEFANYESVRTKSGVPKPTRLETGLTQSRADLMLVEHAIHQARLRAPFDGSVLNVWAKIGEVATPSPNAPLILFGDKSTMRVRAELEERDVEKVRVGQKVVVRTDAHPGRDFIGKVTSLGGALGARNIASRGPRRPSDIDVLEVVADLGAQPLLLPGMRVDVFFANDETAKAETTKSD